MSTGRFFNISILLAVTVAFLAVQLPAAPALADDQIIVADSGKGKGHGQGKGKNKGGNAYGNEKWNDKDRGHPVTVHQGGVAFPGAPHVVVNFPDVRNWALSYGLIGYQPLPPGIRKNLMLGKPLPPGIAKKMVPGPMLAHLPVYPGYQWNIVGNDLVLLALTGAMVAYVLENVFD